MSGVSSSAVASRVFVTGAESAPPVTMASRTGRPGEASKMRVAVSSDAGRKSASNRASVDGDGDQFRVVASAPKTARRISRRLDSTASMTSPAAAQAVCVSGSLVLSEPAAVPPSSIVPNRIAPIQPAVDRRTAPFLILASPRTRSTFVAATVGHR